MDKITGYKNTHYSQKFQKMCNFIILHPTINTVTTLYYNIKIKSSVTIIAKPPPPSHTLRGVKDYYTQLKKFFFNSCKDRCFTVTLHYKA